MPVDRVEFVDREPESAAPGDELATGGTPRPPFRPSRAVAVVVGAVMVLAVALLVGRAVSGDDDGPAASSAPSALLRPTATAAGPPVFGLVGLPRAIGAPRALVTARSGDVVWMLDRSAGIVRIEGGRVTRVQLLEAQATAIAVDPAGQRLYVGTTGEPPRLQELDATTLALGAARELPRTAQSIAVSLDAAWVATAGELLRLDVATLDPLGSVALPGAVLTGELRATQEPVGSQEVVIGVATVGDGAGGVLGRPFRVDPYTQQVTFGPDRPGQVQLATSSSVVWLSWTEVGAGAATTSGYASVVASDPDQQATPALALDSRVYDAGYARDGFLAVAPDSSVVQCRDTGGFRDSEVDVAPTVPDAVITGPVLRSDTALYVVTDRGLVRTGVGACT